MNAVETTKFLTDLGGCGPAISTQSQYGDTLEDMWERGYRGDWLVWLALGLGIDRKQVMRCVCAIARDAVAGRTMTATKLQHALDLIEEWLDGKRTADTLTAPRCGSPMDMRAKAIKALVTIANAPPNDVRVPSMGQASLTGATLVLAKQNNIDEAVMHQRIADAVKEHLPWSVVEVAANAYT